MDEILWCDHSNETSSTELLHGTICFSIFYKMKFWIFFKFDVWRSGELGVGVFTSSVNIKNCLKKSAQPDLPATEVFFTSCFTA